MDESELGLVMTGVMRCGTSGVGLIRPSLESGSASKRMSGVPPVIKCLLVVCDGYPIGLGTNTKV